jgi:hypothetical protein
MLVCYIYPYLLDIQPPDFTNCHRDFQIFAGRNGTAIVHWPTIIATDNSNQTDSCGITKSISIIQTTGKPSSSRLPVGSHEITYTATDGSNNKATCSFTATVEGNMCNGVSHLILSNCLFYFSMFYLITS